uniref:Uncharacterized protein n=1 Tax=Oryza meridionalis TaxID=40149 RepID=A0A0E0EFQ3_9ORYZ
MYSRDIRVEFKGRVVTLRKLEIVILCTLGRLENDISCILEMVEWRSKGKSKGEYLVEDKTRFGGSVSVTLPLCTAALALSVGCPTP